MVTLIISVFKNKEEEENDCITQRLDGRRVTLLSYKFQR